MRRHPLRGLLLGVTLFVAGCADLTHNPRVDQAHERWGHMRATVKLQLAEKSFEKGVIEEAFKQCSEVLRLDPEFVEGYLLSVRIHLERGEISKAKAALATAEGLAPLGPEMLYLRGLIDERQGQLAEALEYYRGAYEARPDDLDYLLAYVECLIATDQHEQALTVITPKRMDFEQSPAVHTLAGQTSSLLGRYVEAAECYRFAYHLAPDNPLLREEAGIAFLAAGWDNEAIEALMPLAHLQTTQPADGPATHISTSAVQALATALVRKGRPDRAEPILERAVRDQPDRPALWVMLAEVHLRSGHVDRAAMAARKGLDLDPDLPDARLVLAYEALQADRCPEAVDLAQTMIDRNPDDVEARAVLARALERSPGGSARAAEHYRHILTLIPGHRWARLQLDRLNQQARAD